MSPKEDTNCSLRAFVTHSNLLMWTLLLFKRGHISASSKDVSHQDLLAEGQRWPKMLQIRLIWLQVVSASNTPSIKWEACFSLVLMWSVWLNKSWFDSWITSYVGWHSLTFWLRTLLRVKERCGWVHLLNVSAVKWHSANIAPAAFCHIICSKWLQLLRTRVTNSEQYVSRTAAEHSIYCRTHWARIRQTLRFNAAECDVLAVQKRGCSSGLEDESFSLASCRLVTLRALAAPTLCMHCRCHRSHTTRRKPFTLPLPLKV